MPSSENSTVALDVDFLDTLLASCRDLAELKAVLFVVRLAHDASSPLVAIAQLLEPAIARTLVPGPGAVPAAGLVRDAVDRAVGDGFLLRLTVDPDMTYVLPATRHGVDVVERLRQGDAGVEPELPLPANATIGLHRPNVFALYEQQVGPLTAVVAEELRDAERTYPRGWIEGAMRVAVDYNKRNWRYIESILRRWEETGAPDEVTRRRA